MVGGTSSSSATARRSFYLCGRRFSFTAESIADSFLNVATIIVEKAVLVLGPILICFASLIISGLSWTFFSIVLPVGFEKNNFLQFECILSLLRFRLP